MFKNGLNGLKFIGFFLTFMSMNAATVIVDSSADDPAVNPLVSPLTVNNEITLRSAIEYTNVLGGSNSIDFAIPGPGPYEIKVGTGAGVAGQALPIITDQLAINGYSQRGSSIATSTQPAVIQIILNGFAITGLQDGLTLGAGSDGTLVRGLVIQSFPGNGIAIQGGSGQSIVGNYVGTDQLGENAVPNAGNGVSVATGVSSVSIGSPLGVGIIGNRNVISGQKFTTGAIPISGAGIFVAGSNNQIIGNYIGTNATGESALSNRTGVYIYSAGPNVPLNNTIQSNVIAFNNGNGLQEGSGIIVDNATQNALLSNSIFNNRGNGISLLNNGNDNLMFPITNSGVISGTTLNVAGSFSNGLYPNSRFILQFFTNPESSVTTQGENFVGQTVITTDASGKVSFENIRLFSNALAGQFVSATATLLDANGNPLETSTYAPNLIIVQGQASGAIDTSITFDPFPGMRAEAVVIDNGGRVIVGGLNGSIVRYNENGAIDLTYATFPGTAVKAMVLDATDNLFAVGSDGFVVKYNPNGTINLIFETFPGVLANAVILDSAGDLVVGGLQSAIVRYSTGGATIGNIITTFDPFAGAAVNGLAMDGQGRILACGLQGQVVRYAPDGRIDLTYEAFPGKAANSLVVDSEGKALVVGKALNPSSLNLVSTPNASAVVNIVRYNTEGAIDLNFAGFTGLNAQNILIDLNSNVIVCGLESLISQYNSSTGAVNFNFENFPGINATWMALTNANQIIAVGWEGSVIRYYN